MRFVDWVPLSIGSVAIAFGWVGMGGNWINCILSVILWITGVLAIGLAILPIFDYFRAKRVHVTPAHLSESALGRSRT